MHPFVRDLVTEWRRLEMPFDEQAVIIAVSGGADSVSLLLAMHDVRQREKLRLRLVAAHYNHKLRGTESDADEQFVRELTSTLGLELAVGRAGAMPDGNLEQNARVARYDFLLKTAAGINAAFVMTGHTINDQAETVLMNLIRGSGPDGLSGMRTVRPLNGGQNTDKSETSIAANTLLVRPLLTWAKRLDTEAYCRDRNVEYRYDTMNEDTAFKRVRIRKILLPLLEDMNPKIVDTLSNTALLMQGLVDRNGNDIAPVPNGRQLGLDVVRSLSDAERTEYLRTWLVRCRGTARQLQLKHIRAIERLALSNKSGRTAELPGGRVVKSGGRLAYEENEVEN
jgi:tRNA(Ile)-lysidine synthase